ncbi:ATP-binding protein [Streptomyces sp. HPF1205]|uniref:ATP-binding protein n=1 Tax=Streptomyces sp. HPF1205 TaxID=2873262 RepID=UPI001CEDF39D|nr:ATP-binding protein [Streptomyces sp. HPF1205]
MTQHQTTDQAAQPIVPTAHLATLFSSTNRGAHLARRFAVRQFTRWTGLPDDSDPVRAVALVTAELASNAVRHGHLPGRDFRLGLFLLADGLRIEVTDTRPERLPPLATPPGGEGTSGRGLLLVQAYADRWGCRVDDALTKTVWARIRTQEGEPAT